MDWNSMIDEEQEKYTFKESGRVVVEEPPSPSSSLHTVTSRDGEWNDGDTSGRGGAGTSDPNDGEEACDFDDVLDIHYDRSSDFSDSEVITECDVRRPIQRVHEVNVNGPKSRVSVDKGTTTTTTTPPPPPLLSHAPQTVTKTTKPRRRVHRRSRDQQSPKLTAATLSVAKRGGWHVRWTRDGFENLLYTICDCNEKPNVVFAALCYQRVDVYTMLLRNCNGKRRYWYDVSKRRGGGFNSTDGWSDDFERAMLWRSKTIGRSCTTPGYDLASFAMQNVTTDRRSYDGTIAPSLVIVTTGGMLTDPSIFRQLLCSDKETATSEGEQWPHQMHQQQYPICSRYYIDRRARCYDPTRGPAQCCRVCRKPAKTVTQDNASLPTFLCWDHSADHMTTCSADRTRVYDAVILDLQFMRDEHTDELTCRVRLVNADTTTGSYRVGNVVPRDGVLTIAELVMSSLPQPHGGRPSSSSAGTRTARLPPPPVVVAVDLQTAHGYGCQEIHYDDGDLFASMPAGGVGGARVLHHDTMLGRLVDRTYCVVCKFQR